MAFAKYSPTVVPFYRHDQEWFKKNCIEDDEFGFDKDGYDLYGYNSAGVDRAGHTESEYLDDYLKEQDNSHETEQIWSLADTIEMEWMKKKTPTLE